MKRILFYQVCIFLVVLPIVGFTQTSSTLWKNKYDSAHIFWNDNKNKSLQLLQDAERIAFNDLGIYDENYLAILNDLGLAYSQVNDYKKAEAYLTQNLAIQKELSADAKDMLQVQCNLATVLLKSGRDKDAKILYKEVLNKAYETKNAIAYNSATENLLKLYQIYEQYDSALALIHNAQLAAFSEHKIQNEYELKLVEVRVLRKNKMYDAAIAVLTSLQKSIDSKTNAYPLIKNSIQIELNLLDIEMGLYAKAEKELLQLYRVLKVEPNPNENLLTELTNGLGYVYEKLSIYDKALIYYQESLNRCLQTQGYNSFGCLTMQNNIAGIYLKQGRIADAINEYEKFISEFQKLAAYKHQSTHLIALNNLATAYRQDGQYAKAQEYFNNIYSILEQKNLLEDDLTATVMNNIAVIYTLQGEHLMAMQYFERVLKIKEKLYGQNSLALLDVISNLAVSYWAVQLYKNAIPLFQRSLALAQKEVRYIFPTLTEAEQFQFYQNHKKNFERFNTLTIQQSSGQPELLLQMFNNQLFLKSFVFFTNKKRNALVHKKNDPTLKNVVTLVETKTIQLGHFYQTPIAELNKLGISLGKLENEIDSLEKIIRHSLSSEKPLETHLAWSNVANSLKEDEALIDIIRFRKYDILSTNSLESSRQINIGFTDSIYYAALITSKETTTHPQLVLLKNGNSLEKRFLNYYRNALKFDVDDTISYSNFWEPFEKYVVSKKKIYISADGVYHQINLNAIRNKGGQFILEKYDLHPILNSTQLVQRNVSRKIDFKKVVLMGDPVFSSPAINAVASTSEQTNTDQSIEEYESLPGTLEELKSIVQILKLTPDPKTVMIRHNANETNLKKINSPSILHIATHGFFSKNRVYINKETKNDFLFHSGIVLSASTKHSTQESNNFDTDGIVTAYDVINLDLTDTELVVLSACETGLGKIENGEGVYGLQRSFLQAGAHDILISLWKVEDIRTKDLMVKFYSNLSKDYSIRDALKRAQLETLKENRNPRLWGAFVMVSGD